MSAASRHDRAHLLLAQLRRFRGAVTALPDAVVLLDRHGRIRWANPAAGPLLGIVRARDRGRSMAELLAASELGRWLRSGDEQPPADIRSPVDPTQHISIDVIAFGPDQHALLARDISHMSRLEKVRRDFVANVSHELRTPLTVIHGYLELLDPGDAPELAPVLGEMRAQSRRMGQIVEDLLTLSRLETQQHLPEERIDMPALLLSLRNEAEALSQGRHHISVEDRAGVHLRGSPRDLHSAFSNLVSNAVRYTPAGGHICISWRRTGHGVAYAVRDDGYGISAEHLPRLSERFYRVSSSRSRNTGGTGLGLSIVKHVLNLHHAQLRIESEPGKGSTFSCLFDSTRLLPATGADD